ALAAFAAEHDQPEHDRPGPRRTAIGTGADARAGAWFQLEERPGAWVVRQIIDDPEGDHDWGIVGQVDLAASDEAGAAVWRTVSFEQAGLVEKD
nr:DUF3516 domain-containing protein [Actinomycetota bacterium]